MSTLAEGLYGLGFRGLGILGCSVENALPWTSGLRLLQLDLGISGSGPLKLSNPKPLGVSSVQFQGYIQVTRGLTVWGWAAGLGPD